MYDLNGNNCLCFNVTIKICFNPDINNFNADHHCMQLMAELMAELMIIIIVIVKKCAAHKAHFIVVVKKIQFINKLYVPSERHYYNTVISCYYSYSYHC